MTDIIDEALVRQKLSALCDSLSQGESRGMSPSLAGPLKTEASILRNLATEDLEPLLLDLVLRVSGSGTTDGFPESFKWEMVRRINEVRDLLR